MMVSSIRLFSVSVHSQAVQVRLIPLYSRFHEQYICYEIIKLLHTKKKYGIRGI